jgi:hypothetical protein
MENNFLYIYVYTNIINYGRFTIQGGLNFQRLVNRTLDLYTKNEEFRKQLNEYTTLQISGSQF